MSSSDFTTSVTYAEIDRFPGYRFGDDGSVWSCSDLNGGFRDSWRQIHGSVYSCGYRYIGLTVNGKTRAYRLARIILEAFVGPAPDGYQACHNDGDKTNNHLSNLRWDSPKGNQGDRREHGTASIGTRHGRAKLRDEDIPVIRQLCLDGNSITKIAKLFGVSLNTVRRVKSGENWTHIP